MAKESVLEAGGGFQPVATVRNKERVDGVSAITSSIGFFWFVFAVFFFISLGFLAYSSYLTFQNHVQVMEKQFIQENSEKLLLLSETAHRAAETGKYAPLSRLMKELINFQKKKNNISSVHELFYLHRKGFVYAHTDLSQLTSDKKNVLSRMSSLYNNEFFHVALMYDRGEIHYQNYPYETYNTTSKSLYILRRLLPVNYFEAIDFQTPVKKKGGAEATLHLVASRRYLDKVLVEQTQDMVLQTAVVFGASFVGTFFVWLVYTRRLKKVRAMIEYLFRHLGSGPVSKKEESSADLDSEKAYIDRKLEEILYKTNEAKARQRAAEIRDAVLIKEG